MRCWKLASFDLDGTLACVSTSQHLAQKIGHAREMAAIEFLYAQGQASNADVANLDGKHYKGYSKSDIATLLADIPVIDQIGETVSYLSQRGIPSLISTLAWNFVAEAFAKRYGFVHWSGPTLVIDDKGLFTGKVAAHFEESDKPHFVKAVCNDMGIAMDDVFHVGDSRSDFPLFKAVGFSIALNGTRQARSIAQASIDTKSLLGIVPLVPGLAQVP